MDEALKNMLLQAAKAVYITVPSEVADSLSLLLTSAHGRIEALEIENRALRSSGQVCGYCNWLERDECIRQKDELRARVEELEVRCDRQAEH